jgi:hypothetical protein
MKKTILSTLVMSLAISGLLTIATTAPANSATCTKKEISTMDKINVEMLFFTVSGDPGKVFTAIDKARQATKSKTLKTLYSKLETAVEQGYVKNGEASKLWLSLQSKMKFKRC